MFSIGYNRVIIPAKDFSNFILLSLLTSIVIITMGGSNPFDPNKNKRGIVLFNPEGYDARTGKWINKKPSAFAYSISSTTYQNVKNWYATDSGNNNPSQLPLEAPKEGYTYIYTPYHDPAHPGTTGMSVYGQEGFKGYWYADDLSKATDSVTATGSDITIAPVVDRSDKVTYGGYDARTGNWINTKPGDDAFSISFQTYVRIKNWYATNFGADNPLNLPLQFPKEDYTYIFVPYNDPTHPGVMGMTFQGNNIYKGYWYADKIGVTNDTISHKQNVPKPTQSGDLH